MADIEIVPYYGMRTPADFDTLFDELEAARGTSASLSDAIGEKADAASTLAGYGITDAYTKAEINTALAAKQGELTTAQQAAVDSGITAAKLAEDEADIATLKGYHAINTISSSSQSPADLDDYKSTGFYIVTSASVAGTIAHAPFTAAGFTLEINPSYQTLGSTRGMIQTATSYISGSTKIKKRWYLYSNSAWAWTEWETII